MDLEDLMRQMLQYGGGDEDYEEENEEEEEEEEEEDMSDKSPLYKLIKGSAKGRLELVREVVESSPNPESFVNTPSNFLTALGVAVDNDQEDVVAYLLSKGADANVESGTPGHPTNPRHPLMLSICRSNTETTRLLLQSGANPCFADAELNFPLLQAANVQEEEICSLLILHGANPDQADYYKTTALHKACNTDYAPLVEAIIRGRPNAENKDKDGQTVLHKASHYCSPDVMRLLLDYGCSLEATNSLGETPLTWSYRNSAKDCGANARLLIRAGADVDARPPAGTSNGMTPLRTAWQRRKTPGVIQLLLADVNVTKEDWVTEWTPQRSTWHPRLMQAIQNYRRPLTLKRSCRKSIRNWLRNLTGGRSFLNHKQAMEILEGIADEQLRNFVFFKDLPATKEEVRNILQDHEELRHLYDPEYEDY